LKECLEFLCKCFGEGIYGIGENRGVGIVPYMNALEWNDRNAMWHTTVPVIRPDFLYKESIFNAGIGSYRKL